jgi:hypothetical protein
MVRATNSLGYKPALVVDLQAERFLKNGFCGSLVGGLFWGNGPACFRGSCGIPTEEIHIIAVIGAEEKAIPTGVIADEPKGVGGVKSGLRTSFDKERYDGSVIAENKVIGAHSGQVHACAFELRSFDFVESGEAEG